MIAQDPCERIRTALHRAALVGADWPEVDRLLCESNDTKGSALGIIEYRSEAEKSVFLAQLSIRGQRREDWERRYFDEYWSNDERLPRFMRLAHGRVAHTGQLYTESEKRVSPAYNEAMLGTRAQNGLHVRLKGPLGSHIAWVICDSTEPGGWRSDQIRLIERLGPHVRQFALVRHVLAEAGVAGTSIAELLGSTRFGAIYLDRRGRIMAANDRALGFLREGDGLLDRDGFLRARSPSADAELSRLLTRALPPSGEPGSAGSMLVDRSSSSARLPLRITPVSEEYPRLNRRRIGLLVLVLDPTGKVRVDPALVSGVLGLTPVESRLAVALAAGDTLRDVARSTGRTVATVRRDLEEIFRKQGISREVDLVRRVLPLEGFPDVPR